MSLLHFEIERTPRMKMSTNIVKRCRPNISSRRGSKPGVRRGSYKYPPWVGYELDSRENVDHLIRDTIRETWTGRLGTRQASAINRSIRLRFKRFRLKQSRLPEKLPSDVLIVTQVEGRTFS